MNKSTPHRLFRSAAALALLVSLTVLASATSTSTNFSLDQQSRPLAAGMSFSSNFQLAGMLPETPAGDTMTSANFMLETVLIPDTYDPIDTTPPVITAGPTVTYISDTTALIEWETDELATGVVDYGLTTSYTDTESHAGFATLHQVLLTGLTASTDYDFQVSSTDAYLNGPTTSPNAAFTTAAGPDTTAPGFVSVSVTFLAVTVARIDFEVDEPTDSDLEWGATAALGTSLPDPAFRLNHSRTIGGLSANTQYFYDITVTDPSGNTSSNGVDDFTMPAAVSITSSTLPGGALGTFYGETIVATGGVGALDYTLSSGTLPPGLILDAATGVLSGTPTTSGTFGFDVLVTDSGTVPTSDNAAFVVVIDGPSSGGGKKKSSCSTSDAPGSTFLLLLAAACIATVALRRRRGLGGCEGNEFVTGSGTGGWLS